MVAPALGQDETTTTTSTTSTTTTTSTTSATTTSPSTTSTTTTRAPRSARLVFGGDVLIHMNVVRAACPAGKPCDFARLLAPTAALVGGADLAVCHLEVPIVAAGERISGYPTFGAPPSLASALAATGWDHCSTASNHSIDRGTKGIDSTIDALEAAGITHAGTARTPDEAARIAIRDVNGIRVALLSATYGLNGLRTPAGQAWRVERIQVDRLVALARIARAQGAEVVVLSLHWGQEYRHRPTPEQRAVAGAITASGAVDLIVGHHAHVVQPIEQINGTWVVFGLGNHLSGQVPAGPKIATQDGLLAEVTVRDDPSGRVVVDPPIGHPTWNNPATRVVHVAADLPGQRAAIASATRTRAVLAGT